MNDKQKNRLTELKNKYFLKYVLTPFMQEFAERTPFKLDELLSGYEQLKIFANE